ncbi:uncharacterized protein L201_004615 [Kwoniella dendrophila CBS 6074]|uniref:Uncharacterized protein n=1 Tax=Kwoniella dendrophila CBS 6074 TaxID=1295534 RepID=A0AAX4JYP3_9TREE
MAAVAQAPPMLPTTSSSGSISRPSSSAATVRPTEAKTINPPPTVKPDTAETPIAKVTVSEATPVEEKGEVKKESGDGEFIEPRNVFIINRLPPLISSCFFLLSSLHCHSSSPLYLIRVTNGLLL